MTSAVTPAGRSDVAPVVRTAGSAWWSARTSTALTGMSAARSVATIASRPRVLVDANEVEHDDIPRPSSTAAREARPQVSTRCDHGGVWRLPGRRDHGRTAWTGT
jgi:hypothetical protein